MRWIVVGCVCLITSPAWGADASPKTRLEEVVVTGTRPVGPFLPDVEGTDLHAGKKKAVIR